jgi:tRNA(adenine34) deaminase
MLIMKSDDIKYLKMAISNSQKSFEEGNFPAGAIVVKEGRILSSTVSVPYPGLLHADSNAIFQAYTKDNKLNNATLYIGLQSCLMCTGVAYWAGIRRIIYAVPKAKVSGSYYETPNDTSNLFSTFNEKIEFIHIPELETAALDIVKKWEEKFINK